MVITIPNYISDVRRIRIREVSVLKLRSASAFFILKKMRMRISIKDFRNTCLKWKF